MNKNKKKKFPPFIKGDKRGFKKKIIFSAIILFVFFSLLNPISAQQYKNQEKIPGAAQQQTDFIPYLKDIINFGFAIIGILALFMLIIGAYQYLMAAGNIGKVESAKETIGSALFGLILGLCAWIILEKINPDLVNMRAITQISQSPGENSLKATPNGTKATPNGTKATPTPIPTSYSGSGKIPEDIKEKAKYYAAKHNVPESIALGMLGRESGGNIKALSPKGAQGLLQLMPGTAQVLGVTDPFDPDQNLNAGYKYVSQLYNQYGDWGMALAAYNWGPGNFGKYLRGEITTMPKETINYVKGIMGSCSFCPK